MILPEKLGGILWIYLRVLNGFLNLERYKNLKHHKYQLKPGQNQKEDGKNFLSYQPTKKQTLGDGNVRTRLGVKTWIKSHNKMDDGKFREFNPFIEANWLHNTRDFSARMDGVTTKQAGGRDIGEVKVGLEGQITSHLNMWGNVGVPVGDKGYNNTSAMLGLKYTF